jgi:hypothetical protein
MSTASDVDVTSAKGVSNVSCFPVVAALDPAMIFLLLFFVVGFHCFAPGPWARVFANAVISAAVNVSSATGVPKFLLLLATCHCGCLCH